MGAVVQGFAALANVHVLIGILIGCVVGMLVGIFPGITATMSVAIASSFTLALPPQQGLAILLSIWIAAMYGDRIPAILVNTPGTPASIATTFDGYPLAQQGKAALALAISTVCSAVGAVFGIAVFAFLSFPLAEFALNFGPAEFFALVLFGLTMMATISSGSLVKGLIAGLIGLAFATVGLDPILGFPRFTFGVLQLQSGIGFIPFIIGLFGIAEVLEQFLTHSPQNQGVATQLGRWFPTKEERKQILKPLLIGSVTGALIGTIPAAGGDIAGLISWDQAKRLSKHPEEFGKGSIEGLSAADTANTSVVGGALTTTLALGIPGDSVTAIFLGSLLIWGLNPGPNLFQDNPTLIYTIVGILLIATAFLFVLSLIRIQGVAKLLSLPRPLLWSGIVLFCVVGTFAVQNSFLDVWIMLGAGVLGLVLRRLGFSPGPVVLGLLLGPLAESNLRRTLIISNGSFDIFLTSPIAMLLFAISAIALITSFVRSRRQRKQTDPKPEPEE